MPHLPLHLTVPVFLLVVLAEIWFERRKQRNTYSLAGALSNLSVGLVEASFGVFSHLAILVAYEWQFHYWAMGQWSVSDPLIWIIGFLVYEYCYYWKHRLGHEINFMWAGHVVHHQSEEMNLSTGLRLSGTSPLYDIVFYVPMALIGIPPFVYLVMKVISLSYQLFLHTEHIRYLPAWAEYVFNTPAHHRVHHSRHEGHLDRNYGSILILYDRWFGTFADDRIAPEYGTTEPIRSYNPIYVNLAHYGLLFRQFWDAPSGRERWRMLFDRPAVVANFYGKKVMPTKDSTDPVLASERTDAASRYLLLQFGLVCWLTYFYLRDMNEWALTVKIVGLVYIFFLFWGIGKLLDRGHAPRWRQETWRHVSYLLVLLIAVGFASYPLYYLLFGVPLILLSGWWYWCEYTREVPMV